MPIPATASTKGNAGTRLANKAWTQLYTFLSTAGGTIAGNVHITGNLSVAGTTTLDGTTATTPPSNDNTTHVATTAWVTAKNYLTANQTITLSGDVSGSGATSIPATVTGLQGHAVSNTAPASGQVLEWTGSAWTPTTPASGGGGVTSITAGAGLTGGTITTTGTIALSSPVAIANGGTNATTAGAGADNLHGFAGTTAGLVRRTGAATYALDSSTYLTGNQTITVSGDASGSGTTAIALTLATVNSSVGTWNNLTVNGKGLVTAGSNIAYLTANQTITLSGDLSGSGATAISGTVTGLQGHPVSATAPTSNQVLEWSGTAWTPTSLAAGGTITGVTAGTGLSGGGTSGAVTVSLSTPVAIANGGTGATTAAAAVTNLGALPLTGGTLTGALSGTTAGFSGQVTGSSFVAGNTTVGSNGMQTTGIGGLGVTPVALGQATGGYPLVSLNGASPQYLVSGTVGGYQSCTNVAMASNFSYGLLGQAGSLYSFTIAPSDRRAKANIEPAKDDALRIVRQVPVHDLDYRPRDDILSEHWNFSLLTDEVKPHLPYAVIPAPQAEGITGYESFHAQHLVSVLWRALQQMADRLEALEGKT